MAKETRSKTVEEESVLFNQILREAMGISDQAADALRVLLSIGPMTPGEISTKSGLGFALTSKAMTELENERLVRRIPSVVDRFAIIPPYAGFVAFLKDFQKIAKNVGDITTSVVDSTLATISQNCGEWKKEAQQTAKSSTGQTISEIDLFKQNSSKNVSEMLEKLKQETEVTKNMVTDAIKKHVDTHKMKSNEAEEELASGISNVSNKFDVAAKKYLKEATDMTSTFLENCKGGVQTFMETVNTNLQEYKTQTRENLTLLENEITSIQGKLEEKGRTTILAAKTKSSDTLESQRKTFGEKSMEVQSSIRDVTDRFMKTASSNLSKFKSSVDGTMKEFTAEWSKLQAEFKEKLSASVVKWWSSYKADVNESAQVVYRSMDTLTSNLIREGDKISSTAQAMVGSFAAKAKSSFDELKTKVEEIYSGGLANLSGASSAIKGTLSGVIASHTSSCQLTTSFLESTLSTIIPSCNNALGTVVSDIEKNLQKMSTSLSKKNDALLSGLSQRAENKVSSYFPALEKNVNGIVERILASIPSIPIAESSARTSSKKSPATTRRASVTAEVREVLKGFEKKMTDELRKYFKEEISTAHSAFEKEIAGIQADVAAVPSTSIKNARTELGKGEVVAASLLPRFAEYSSSVGSFENQVLDLIDVSTKQYVGESEIAKKALADLFADQIASLGKIHTQVTESANAQHASKAKEINDLTAETHTSLDAALAKHLDQLDGHIQQGKSNLQQLVTQISKNSDGARSSVQSNVNKLVNSTLAMSKEITETTTNSVRGAMAAVTGEFDNSTAALQKDLTSFAAQATEEIKSLVEGSTTQVSESKENLSRQIDQSTGKTLKELNDVSNKQISTMVDTTSAIGASISKLTSTSLGEFKSEAAGAKEKFQRLISSHLQDYEQEAFGAGGTCGYLLSRSYERYREISMVNEKNLQEALLTHQTRFENSMNNTDSTLMGCIDKNEALLKEETRKALANFRENIDKLRKASASVEWVLQSAWMELEKSPMFGGEKSWPLVTKVALMSHVQDMIKRTKSHIMIMLPTVSDAPLEEIPKVKKATRVTLVVGETKGDEKQMQALAEIAKMGNVSLRASTDLSCYGCSKDSEEILFAPMAQKDTELVGLVSIGDPYIELFEKILTPALLGSSYDLKESAKPQTTPRKSEK
jgi:sugar-specific transcriptional regulator TrmB